MKITFFFQKAMEKAVEFLDFKETENKKLFITNVESIEFGWIFNFQNFYFIDSVIKDVTNYDLSFFNFPAILIDKFDGELIQIGFLYDDELDKFLTKEEFIENYFLKKYPNYWKEKELELLAQKKDDEEFDEWIKTLEGKNRVAKEEFEKNKGKL